VTRNAVVAAPKTKTAAKLLKPMRAVFFMMNIVKTWVLSQLWKATFAHKTLVLYTPVVNVSRALVLGIFVAHSVDPSRTAAAIKTKRPRISPRAL